MTVYFPEAHTPAEWRAMAAQRHASAAESFDRCDTDGFLSQWAADCTARLYEFCAELAERGGTWEFSKLADADGNIIENAKLVSTRYGFSWAIEIDSGTRWFNPSKARDAAEVARRDLAKGYQVIRVERAAVAVLSGSGHALFPAALERRTAPVA